MLIKNCRKFFYRVKSDNGGEVRWFLDMQLYAVISEMVGVARVNYYSLNTSTNGCDPKWRNHQSIILTTIHRRNSVIWN
jgi:hypothetical protein